MATPPPPSPLSCCGVACSVLEEHGAPETSGSVGISASWRLGVTAKEKESHHDGTVVVMRSPEYLETQRQSNQTPALLWSLFKVELCVPTDMVINPET